MEIRAGSVRRQRGTMQSLGGWALHAPGDGSRGEVALTPKWLYYNIAMKGEPASWHLGMPGMLAIPGIPGGLQAPRIPM